MDCSCLFRAPADNRPTRKPEDRFQRGHSTFGSVRDEKKKAPEGALKGLRPVHRWMGEAGWYEGVIRSGRAWFQSRVGRAWKRSGAARPRNSGVAVNLGLDP